MSGKTNRAAWLKKPLDKPFVVEEAPLYTPGPDDILVRNHAVAINPADWKIQDIEELSKFIPNYPTVLGFDGAGIVEAVGSNIKNFAPGDRILSSYDGMATGIYARNAFQEYALASPNMSAKLASSVSFTAASVLPVAISTAAAGLYSANTLKLRPWPSAEPPAVGPSSRVLVVWGGSSSVGSTTIQLARASGLEVVATASPRNHAMCREIGASNVFDHSSGSVVEDIVAALKGRELAGVYDAISTEPTARACYEIANRLQGNKFVVSVTPGLKLEGIPDGVTTGSVFATTIGTDEVGPAVWGGYVGQALANGSLLCKPDPLVIGQGLEHVQAAVQKNKEGVSAAKVVVELP